MTLNSATAPLAHTEGRDMTDETYRNRVNALAVIMLATPIYARLAVLKRLERAQT